MARSYDRYMPNFLQGSGLDFPGVPSVKNLSANIEDTGPIPGLGRFHMLRDN